MLIFLFLQLILTLILTVGTILLLVLAAAWGAYYFAFHSPRKGQDDPFNIPSGDQYMDIRGQMHDMITALNDLPFERVCITSEDGLRLSGRYYHQADGAPLDIGFHGYHSSYLTDFCGGGTMSISQGHNLLLIDQRAHGKSQGKTISFGINERRDALSWIHYAIDRFGSDVRIVLYGVSMGGSTVLMASELDLPENIRGIVADCPYSSPMDIITEVGYQQKYPMKLIFASPERASRCILDAVFRAPGRGKWIGPMVLRIWGGPRVSRVRGCSTDEKPIPSSFIRCNSSSVTQSSGVKPAAKVRCSEVITAPQPSCRPMSSIRLRI
jgi:hypothetical protein